MTFLKTDGTTVVKNFTVQPTSRFNVAVRAIVPEIANESFGTLIEVTNGVGIAVERAMYSDSRRRRLGRRARTRSARGCRSA